MYVSTLLLSSDTEKRASDPITDDCEPPCSCWELNSGSLEEQSVLLTTEPSLQPCILEFLTLCSHSHVRKYFCVRDENKTWRDRWASPKATHLHGDGNKAMYPWPTIHVPRILHGLLRLPCDVSQAGSPECISQFWRSLDLKCEEGFVPSEYCREAFSCLQHLLVVSVHPSHTLTCRCLTPVSLLKHPMDTSESSNGLNEDSSHGVGTSVSAALHNLISGPCICKGTVCKGIHMSMNCGGWGWGTIWSTAVIGPYCLLQGIWLLWETLWSRKPSKIIFWYGMQIYYHLVIDQTSS